MRLRAVTYSAGFHVALLVIWVFGLPFISSKRDIHLPQPMVVEFVELSDKARTNKKPKIRRPHRPPVRKPTKNIPKPPKKRPPKVATNRSMKPITPPDIRQKIDKSSSPKIDDVSLDKTTKIVKKPILNKKVAQQQNFNSVLKNLADNKDETVEEENQFVPISMRITMGEQDALRRQLEGCWTVPIGARGIEDMVIEIKMEINPNKTVKTARIVNQGRYKRDSFFRAVADTALRAVRSPDCSPLILPTKKYNTWKRTTISFNPRDMF